MGWVRALGALAALGTLVVALVAIFRSLRRPPGRMDPAARVALRPPMVLFVMLLFLGAAVLLWHPLPVRLSSTGDSIVTVLGASLLLSSLSLYLWSMKTLGRMFGPSSGFAVRLQEHHLLVTSGPYAWIRHPMYLAAINVGVSLLLLFPTWATLAFAIAMFGLLVRARREDKILRAEFGAEWEAYAQRVPPWFPTLRQDQRRGA